MPSKPVVLHEEALADAEAAYAWYRDRREEAAAGFFNELDRAIESIGMLPEAWPPYVAGTRRYLMRRFPFSVVYRETGEAVEVVAIAHFRRRPNYWRQRLQ